MNRRHSLSWITTAQGIIIPDLFFRGEEDKIAQILCNQAASHVFMYEGNPTYPQKMFNLQQHVMGLMDIFLSHPKIKDILANIKTVPAEYADFVTKTGIGILDHDSGEVGAGEEMTFMMKCLYPDLVPYAKEMEAFMAVANYEIATIAAIADMPAYYLKQTRKIQKFFSSQLTQLEDNLFAPSFYQESIKQTLGMVDQLRYEMRQTLKPYQKELVTGQVEAYRQDYNSVENPDSPLHRGPQRLVKIIDKSCPSYTDHARRRLLDPFGKTPLHDRFTNKAIVADLERKEKPLINYMAHAETDDLAAAFRHTATDIACGAMSEYLVTARPVISGSKEKPLQEMSLDAKRSEWLNNIYLPQVALVDHNRQSGIHFLQDDLKTNLELYALVKAKQLTGQYLTQPLLDKNVKYTRKFAELTQHLWAEAKQAPLVPAHPDYEYPSL